MRSPALLASFGLAPGDPRLEDALRDPKVEKAIVFSDTQRRVGFALLYPPKDPDVFWEYIAAIPEEGDRNLFTAMQTLDAMAYYAFEWMKVLRLGFRIERSNEQPQAAVRRMGYAPTRTEQVEGKSMLIYVIERSGWAERLAALEQGELKHPSGLGATFLRVTPPYVIRQPPRAPGGPIRG
ncbi:MAG: hypothetical protein U1E65_20635 [Myxococcota bacterium]